MSTHAYLGLFPDHRPGRIHDLGRYTKTLTDIVAWQKTQPLTWQPYDQFRAVTESTPGSESRTHLLALLDAAATRYKKTEWLKCCIVHELDYDDLLTSIEGNARPALIRLKRYQHFIEQRNRNLTREANLRTLEQVRAALREKYKTQYSQS